MTRVDLFKIVSTSDEAQESLTVGDKTYTIVQWQAIVGRLYARAAMFKTKTNKHEAWRKAKLIRDKVNDALRGEDDEVQDA